MEWHPKVERTSSCSAAVPPDTCMNPRFCLTAGRYLLSDQMSHLDVPRPVRRLSAGKLTAYISSNLSPLTHRIVTYHVTSYRIVSCRIVSQ